MIGAAIALAPITSAAGPQPVGIEVFGTAFHLSLSDGSNISGYELEGAMFTFEVDGAAVRVLIAGVTPDPVDPTGSVMLHDFRVAETNEPLCRPDPNGLRVGFPLSERAAPNGLLVSVKPTQFEIVCTSGARGKCVRLGYHPWEIAPDGRAMRDYYNACVRLLRADYCGDGRSWTRTGTPVDLYDDLDVQVSDTRGNSAFALEAGWGPGGAVCVARTRIPEILTLEQLATLCPKATRLPSCDETTALAAGAIVFSRLSIDR